MNAHHPAPSDIQSPSPPDWLEDRAPTTIPDTPLIRAQIAANQTAIQELEQQTFSIAFEMLLEQMAGGASLSHFCRTYHTPLPDSRFRTWIYRNLKRKQAYLAAKAVGAEAVEDEMIRIADGIRADGSELPEDVTRSNLRISTRKWLLQVWNRQRYGDKTTIEQTTTTTTVDVASMSSEDLKRFILAQNGGDAMDLETLNDLIGEGSDGDDRNS